MDADLWCVRFTAPLVAAQPQRVDREVVARLAQQPGFRGYYACPVGEREGVVVSLWATQAAAAQALALVIPVAQRRGGAPLAGPPGRAGGEAVLARPPGGA